MGITGILLPLVLLIVLAAVGLLVQGLRVGNTHMTLAAAALFLLLAVGYALSLHFITAM